MRAYFIIIICELFIIQISYSQRITGIVKDEKDKPLISSTALLYKASDTALLKTAISNMNGKYLFNQIKPGNYFIKITNIGFANNASAVFSFKGTDKSLPAVVMKKATVSLKNVTVTAKKPVVEVKADKIIFNVENSINSTGKNALELLRTSPGVMIDQDDNISLAGKSGVQIYIDGKPSPLSAKDLSAYLKTLPSSAIEAIEIINNPSSRYDAAGTGGIINIKLKKNKIFGTNGSVNAEYQEGTFPKYLSGFTLNHRDKNINFYSNYNYTHALNQFVLNVFRNLSDTIFDGQGERLNHQNAHHITTGIDFFINDKSTIGAMFDGNFSNDHTNWDNTYNIKYAPTNTTDRLLVSDNVYLSTSANKNFNLNYHYEDTLGHKLDMDANYGSFQFRNNELQPNVFYDPDRRNVLSSEIFTMITPSDINIYNYKADYEQNLKKGRLGLGVKTGFVNLDNFFNLYNHDNSSKLWFDSSQYNHFLYKENINAAYANYNRSFKNWQIQAGVRLEQTNITGQSNGFVNNISDLYRSKDSTFKRNYIDLFPSGSVTFNKNPKNQYVLSYSRRINRPSYQNLNPFEERQSAYGGFKGNPNLHPEYANSFTFTNIFHSLVTSISYSHTENAIISVSDTVDKVKSHYSPNNLGSINNVSLVINYSLNKKWYSLLANVTGYHSSNKGSLSGGTIDLKINGANMYVQNDFTLGKGWSGSLSCYYASPFLFRGTMTARSLMTADIGLQKKVMRDKGSFRISRSDLFSTMRFIGTSNFAGQYLYAYATWEAKQYRLSFTYRFGSTQVKEARKRNAGNEDESNRAKEKSSF